MTNKKAKKKKKFNISGHPNVLENTVGSIRGTAATIVQFTVASTIECGIDSFYI